MLTSEETQQMEEYMPNQQLRPHTSPSSCTGYEGPPLVILRQPHQPVKPMKLLPQRKKFQQGNDSSFHFLPLQKPAHEACLTIFSPQHSSRTNTLE